MNKIAKTVFVLLGGVVTSYLAGLLSSPKERKKATRTIQAMMDRVDWDEVSQKVLGQSNDQVQQQLKKVLSTFAAKIQTMRQGTEENIQKVTNKDYDRMVESLTKKLEKDETFTKDQLKRLSNYLRNDFRLVEG